MALPLVLSALQLLRSFGEPVALQASQHRARFPVDIAVEIMDPVEQVPTRTKKVGSAMPCRTSKHRLNFIHETAEHRRIDPAQARVS